MRLTDNFTLAEFLRSSTAKRKGHVLEPNEQVKNNLTRLAQDVLQPVRSLFAAAVTITSGFRDLWLNTEIGGSSTSSHMDGRAADFYIAGLDLHEVAEIIENSNINFDKLIFEGDWIHIQVAKPGRMPRRLVYTAVFTEDGVTYTRGLY